MEYNRLCEQLLAFISELADSDISMSSKLLDEELVDSFNMINIVNFLEDTLRVQVDPDDVVSERFADIDAIANWGLSLTE